MLRRVRRRLTYANVVATLALFIAVGTGGAYAANTIGSSDIIDESLLSQDIKNGEIKNADLGADSITSTRLANGSIQNSDLGPDAVTTSKIKAGNVGTTDIADNAILTGKIGDGNVFTNDLADGAVSSAKVLDENLAANDLAADSVGFSEIQTDGVQASEVADNSIDSGEIVDFGLSNQDVGVLFAQVNADGTVLNSSGTVTALKLGTGTYEVDFGHDVSNCAGIATQGEGGIGGAGGAIMGVTDRSGNAEAYFVTVRSETNALVDRAFQLAAIC